MLVSVVAKIPIVVVIFVVAESDEMNGGCVQVEESPVYKILSFGGLTAAKFEKHEN